MQFSQVKGQNNVISKLISTIDRNQFPHAVLINGKDGYGNLALALALAQYISCTNKNHTHKDSCGECSSCRKYQKLIHPDLHLIFPTNTTDKIKKDSKSSLFVSEFREFVLNNGGYGDLNDWLSFSGVESKQGIINIADANDIISLLSLKTYEAKYKIMIVWNVDRMNTDASNTILKILEEPYPNTLFILTTEHIGIAKVHPDFIVLVPRLQSFQSFKRLRCILVDGVCQVVVIKESDTLNQCQRQSILFMLAVQLVDIVVQAALHVLQVTPTLTETIELLIGMQASLAMQRR